MEGGDFDCFLGIIGIPFVLVCRVERAHLDRKFGQRLPEDQRKIADVKWKRLDLVRIHKLRARKKICREGKARNAGLDVAVELCPQNPD